MALATAGPVAAATTPVPPLPASGLSPSFTMGTAGPSARATTDHLHKASHNQGCRWGPDYSQPPKTRRVGCGAFPPSIGNPTQPSLQVILGRARARRKLQHQSSPSHPLGHFHPRGALSVRGGIFVRELPAQAMPQPGSSARYGQHAQYDQWTHHMQFQGDQKAYSRPRAPVPSVQWEHPQMVQARGILRNFCMRRSEGLLLHQAPKLSPSSPTLSTAGATAEEQTAAAQSSPRPSATAAVPFENALNAALSPMNAPTDATVEAAFTPMEAAATPVSPAATDVGLEVEIPTFPFQQRAAAVRGDAEEGSADPPVMASDEHETLRMDANEDIANAAASQQQPDFVASTLAPTPADPPVTLGKVTPLCSV